MSTFLTIYTLHRNLKSSSIHIRNFLNYNVYYIPSCYILYQKNVCNSKAELLQLNHTQFPSLGIFVGKKVENQKN